MELSEFKAQVLRLYLPSFLFLLFCLLKHFHRSLTDFCSTTSKLGSALEGKLLQTVKLINGQSLLFWSLFSFSPFNSCPSHGCIFNWNLTWCYKWRGKGVDNLYQITVLNQKVIKHQKDIKSWCEKQNPKKSRCVPKFIVYNPAVVNPSKVEGG